MDTDLKQLKFKVLIGQSTLRAICGKISNYVELVQAIKKLRAKEQNIPEIFEIRYYGEDQDKILITDQDEFDDALDYFKNSKISYIKLELADKGQADRKTNVVDDLTSKQNKSDKTSQQSEKQLKLAKDLSFFPKHQESIEMVQSQHLQQPNTALSNQIQSYLSGIYKVYYDNKSKNTYNKGILQNNNKFTNNDQFGLLNPEEMDQSVNLSSHFINSNDKNQQQFFNLLQANNNVQSRTQSLTFTQEMDLKSLDKCYNLFQEEKNLDKNIQNKIQRGLVESQIYSSSFQQPDIQNYQTINNNNSNMLINPSNIGNGLQAFRPPNRLLQSSININPRTTIKSSTPNLFMKSQNFLSSPQKQLINFESQQSLYQPKVRVSTTQQQQQQQSLKRQNTKQYQLNIKQNGFLAKQNDQVKLEFEIQLFDNSLHNLDSQSMLILYCFQGLYKERKEIINLIENQDNYNKIIRIKTPSELGEYSSF